MLAKEEQNCYNKDVYSNARIGGLMLQKSVYYPAISVGTFQSALIDDEKYFGKSFRFYEEDNDNSFFKYPYLLISAAHNYKKGDLRTKINFPKTDEHMLFIDSGGFQLATGALDESKYGDKTALEWSDKNGDIFPILDRPPYITGKSGVEDSVFFKTCLKKSVISAKYYSDNRSNPDAKILNVLHGRTMEDLEYWYKFLSPFKFEGWAGGGVHTLAELLRSVLFLKKKGEFDRKGEKVFYHIFGISKASFMPYIEYVQHLFNKAGYNLVISFDSSYPMKTSAFGNYFLYTSITGISQMKWSNQWKELYEKKLTDAHRLPCPCPICTSVTDIREFLREPKVFYNIAAAHNLYRFFDFKRTIENLVFLDMPELWESSFDSITRRNFKIIEKAFNMKKGWYEYLKNEIIEKPGITVTKEIDGLFS